MGQGLYNAIVFGTEVPDDWWTIGGPLSEEKADWLLYRLPGELSINIAHNYEATNYIGIPLAASDGVNHLSGGFQGAADLPTRCVYTLSDLASLLQQYGSEIEKARKKWNRFRRAAKKRGIDLPEGELLFVNDWD